MIRVKGTWHLDETKDFPDDIKLITHCPDCYKDVNVIFWACYHIPEILKYIKPNGNGTRDIFLNCKCPECDYLFQISSLIFNGGNFNEN